MCILDPRKVLCHCAFLFAWPHFHTLERVDLIKLHDEIFIVECSNWLACSLHLFANNIGWLLYTHHSEIIMLATSLDRRLHPVAKVVIEKVLEVYTEVIKESKKESLLNLNRRMYASLEKDSYFIYS